MRRLLTPLAMILALAAGPAAAQTRFLETLEDVPLPPGFIERAGAAFVFEGAEGRLLEAAADGPAPLDDARAFHREALPPLGWSAAGADVFERGRERLVLRYEATPRGVAIRYRLLVRPASGAVD